MALVEGFVNEKAGPNAELVIPGHKSISPSARLKGKHFAINSMYT